MGKERLSQVQKAILLVADELLREFRKNMDSRISYKLIVKRLARKADRVHERSRCIEQAFLVTVSRSIRNMAEKGMVELDFSRCTRYLTYFSDSHNLRFISLTGKGKSLLERVKSDGGWENNTWLEKNLKDGKERRRIIRAFFHTLYRKSPGRK